MNALAQEIVKGIGVPVTEPITATDVNTAVKERLIVSRATHLDSLLARLQEDRVRRGAQPIIAGAPREGSQDDDYQYATDLGLLAPGVPLRIANPIYREIILRVLSSLAERIIVAEPRSYVAADGRLDASSACSATSPSSGARTATSSPAPCLTPRSRRSWCSWAPAPPRELAGGFIDREVGIGKKRIDLLVRSPTSRAASARCSAAFELKVWRDRDRKGDPLAQGLKQIDEYLAKLGLDAASWPIRRSQRGGVD